MDGGVTVCTKSLVLLTSVLISAGIGTCLVRPSAPDDLCGRVGYWFIWGNRAPAPATCRADLDLGALPPDNVLSGTICYDGGRSRPGDSVLPLSCLELDCGGLVIGVEDARWSSLDLAREALSGRGDTLVASIRGWFDAGEVRTLDYRLYHFEPGEAIRLELPFSVAIERDDSEHAGSYAVTLGSLEVSGEQRWNETDRLWEPIFTRDEQVRVKAGMTSWAAGARYGTVTLDSPLESAEQLGGDGQWRLRASGSQVLCEALQTGTAEAL
jgi:hypothetical protein